MNATQKSPRYIVMTASAKMPASVKARYRRVAVVELDGTVDQPAMISPRARGVARVVQTWERQHVGQTARCAYNVAMTEAAALVANLSAAA